MIVFDWLLYIVAFLFLTLLIVLLLGLMLLTVNWALNEAEKQERYYREKK